MVKKTINQSSLDKFRQQTFRLFPSLKLQSTTQAVDFVNQRGYIFFWPIKNLTFPSLWSAVAGDRPVADNHDDPGHITWGWKDELLDKRVWYYGRILRKKNTIISLNTIPYFYALSPNYGEPAEEILDQYQSGLLPLEAKLIFEALDRNGPLDSISLRREAHLTGKASQAPFNRAMEILQRQFKILPTGISQAGAWHYSFIYDLTHRRYPDLLVSARNISEVDAQDHLVHLYFKSMGAASQKDVNSLLSWTNEQLNQCILRLVKKGVLTADVSLMENGESLLSLPELIRF